MLHGVAPDTLAQHPGGVVDALRPRKVDGVAEFLDSLIDERKQLVNESLFDGVAADKLAQPLQGRCELGGGFFKISLKIRQQAGKIAALRAFGAVQPQLGER